MLPLPVTRAARALCAAAAPALAAVALLAPAPAHAGLSILRPTPSSPATFYGHGGFSSDGIGSAGTVQAEVPAGSQVVQAYLYGTYYSAPANAANRTFDFDGTEHVLDTIYSAGGGFATVRGDVTAQVAAKVGTGGGITDFAVDPDKPGIDGLALVVIYSNPASPQVTIAVLDGGAAASGDTATFGFASPLDTSIAGFRATMALGIGFSFQPGALHACGGGQVSRVDVNGQRLTSCAGNMDDSGGSGLITVGGVGDSTDNPDPLATNTGTDDELYDLAPFLDAGDTTLTIDTVNPSQDDNVFLAIVEITARAGVGSGGEAPPPPADPDATPAAAALAPVLSGGPAALTNATTAAPQFAAAPGDEGTVSFECNLDDGGWAPCVSGGVFGGLAEGEHTLRVRGVNSAAAAGPATTLTWRIDATKPAAPPVVSAPDSRSKRVSIPFTTEPGATSECSLDTAAFAACTSPFTADNLASGAHVLRIRQRDAAGNLGEVRTVEWTTSASSCVSRRWLRVNWTVPRGTRLRRIVAQIGDRKPVTLLGTTRRTAVDLRGTPRGSVRVKVTATTTSGRRLATTRVYRTCAGAQAKRVATIALKPVRRLWPAGARHRAARPHRCSETRAAPGCLRTTGDGAADSPCADLRAALDCP